MKKEEYLDRLNKALNGVRHEEAARLVEYYRELIEDGLENADEEEFISKLEPPELVAENFRKEEKTDETNFIKNEEVVSQNKNTSNKDLDVLRRIVLMILCIVFAFFGAIALFVLGTIVVTFTIYGLYIFVAAFALLASHTAVAFAQMGYGLVLSTLGIALGYFMPFSTKGYIHIIRKLCMKETTFAKPKNTIKVLCGFGSGVVAGLFIFFVSFASLGFSVTKLTCVDDMILKEEVIDLPTNSLDFTSDNLSLDIYYTDEEKVKIEYYDFENNLKNLDYKDGKVSLISKDKMGDLSLVWRRGVFFKMNTGKYYEAKLYLPSSTTFDLSIEIGNGKISLKQMAFNNLNLSTSNGAVELNNVKASNMTISTNNGVIGVKNCEVDNANTSSDNGTIFVDNTKIKKDISVRTGNGLINMKNVISESLNCKSNNGMIRLSDCQSEKLFAETDNGAIFISRIQANDIELVTSNGAISGTINGKRSDYRIDARTGLGTNNLVNKEDGTKVLKARTGDGSINIKFLE
ncbi:MAG: DUF4097 family beta strand repeat protein [Erysipelotrichales bacterium]|nr:DUF4097 family beta strand repeat protein [Erysipelotrichales bacterium]